MTIRWLAPAGGTETSSWSIQDLHLQPPGRAVDSSPGVNRKFTCQDPVPRSRRQFGVDAVLTLEYVLKNEPEARRCG